ICIICRIVLARGKVPPKADIDTNRKNSSQPPPKFSSSHWVETPRVIRGTDCKKANTRHRSNVLSSSLVGKNSPHLQKDFAAEHLAARLCSAGFHLRFLLCCAFLNQSRS